MSTATATVPQAVMETMTRQRFAREWNVCETIDEFCKKVGMDRRDASNRAASLRRRGTVLKCMPRIRKAGKGAGLVVYTRGDKITGRCIRFVAGVWCVIEVYSTTLRVIVSTHEREQDAERAANGLAAEEDEDD